MSLFDVHLHLQDDRLSSLKEEGFPYAIEGGLEMAIVNGTSPADWNAVSALAKDHSWIRPAYGVHPWKANATLEDDWDELLDEKLREGAISIGEIGLDRWIEGYDFPKQIEVFERQLEMALQFKIPPTVHCLRAWGQLKSVFERYDFSSLGFLLHGYGGSPEMVREFVDLGAYFSFSGYIGDPGRKKARDAMRAVPLERLLLETDAPDMMPPLNQQLFRLTDASGANVHHPGNIEVSYALAAKILELPRDLFEEKVSSNVKRLFCPA